MMPVVARGTHRRSNSGQALATNLVDEWPPACPCTLHSRVLSRPCRPERQPQCVLACPLSSSAPDIAEDATHHVAPACRGAAAALCDSCPCQGGLPQPLSADATLLSRWIER